MIFIDSGPLLAKHLPDDQFHEKSLRLWQKIDSENLKCFTSNFVLNEFLTLLARRADYPFACQKADLIFASSRFSILRPDLKEELEALRFFKKYAGQKIGFTDCISFALMQKHKISQVFSFDKHFEYAGFHLI